MRLGMLFSIEFSFEFSFEFMSFAHVTELARLSMLLARLQLYRQSPSCNHKTSYMEPHDVKATGHGEAGFGMA